MTVITTTSREIRDGERLEAVETKVFNLQLETATLDRRVWVLTWIVGSVATSTLLLAIIECIVVTRLLWP